MYVLGAQKNRLLDGSFEYTTYVLVEKYKN